MCTDHGRSMCDVCEMTTKVCTLCKMVQQLKKIKGDFCPRGRAAAEMAHRCKHFNATTLSS